MGLMNIAKTKVMVEESTTLNVNNVLIENVGGIRQTPGYLQKQPCHLLEETGVQLLCAASYEILCRNLDTDQTSTEQTCGRTDQTGKKYAQHHEHG